MSHVDDLDYVTILECVVQSQKPAVKPWEPVTDYSLDSRRRAEGQNPALILQHLVGERGDILDYGCGPEMCLVRLLMGMAPPGVGVYGYDPQIPGSEERLTTWKYDLVVCREVLEHCTVKQVITVIADLVRLAGKYIYVTTRFAKDPDHILSVDQSDDLDPTHITMLNKDFLRTLFILHGCKSRYDLEAKMDWKKLGRVLVFEV